MANLKRPKPRTSKIAEGLFEQLGLAAGVVVNRVDDDQNGWDLILEYPAPLGDRPPDTRPAALTCLVQIKSSVSKANNYRLKLSNALKFSRHPLPCFVVKITFCKDGKTPIDFYVQHFWHDAISETLKAVRKADAAGKGHINRVELTFGFEPDEKLASENIIDHIHGLATSFQNYSETKLKYAESVGYEQGAAKRRFTLASKDELPSMLDMMLGRGNEVKIEDVIIHPMRFGIPEKKPLKIPKGGRLTAKVKPAATCSVSISPIGGAEQVSPEGEVYAARIPLQNDELQKVRITTDFLEILFTPSKAGGEVGHGTIESSFHTADKRSLENLHQIASTMLWLQHGKIDVKVWVDGQCLFAGMVESDAPIPGNYWERLKSAVETLKDFIPKNQHPKLFRVAIEDFADMSVIGKFNSVVNSVEATLKFEADVAVPADGTATFVSPYFLELGDHTFFAIGEHVLKTIERKDGKYVARLSGAKILSRALLRGSKTDPSNEAFIMAEMQKTHSAPIARIV